MPDQDPNGPQPFIVTFTPTVDSGLVLKWWRPEWSHAGLAGPTPLLSVSRHGVLAHSTYLHEIPADVLAEANEAYLLLRDGADGAAKAKVTHRYDRGAMRLERLER